MNSWQRTERGTPCVFGEWSASPSVCRVPFQELAAAYRAGDPSMPCLHLPTHRHHRSSSLLLPAFVCVVADVRITALLGELAAIRRIIDHQIRVAAKLNCPLAGIKSE